MVSCEDIDGYNTGLGLKEPKTDRQTHTCYCHVIYAPITVGKSSWGSRGVSISCPQGAGSIGEGRLVGLVGGTQRRLFWTEACPEAQG